MAVRPEREAVVKVVSHNYMKSNLLIVFVKNAVQGKVKTRLSKTIGESNALIIYKQLLTLTQNAVNEVSSNVHIYFSDTLEQHNWRANATFVQKGEDLGERMFNAFRNGFELGYKNIVLIGSDLPEISADIIHKGFESLSGTNVVFGPSEDGGYYLIGLSQMISAIFTNKPWSQNHLLKDTLEDLSQEKIEVTLIDTLNDIDTFDDLKSHPNLLKLIE